MLSFMSILCFVIVLLDGAVLEFFNSTNNLRGSLTVVCNSTNCYKIFTFIFFIFYDQNFEYFLMLSLRTFKKFYTIFLA